VGPEQKDALRRAFARASEAQPPGEPLEWMDNVCPRRWRLGGQTVPFDWYRQRGVLPFDEP